MTQHTPPPSESGDTLKAVDALFAATLDRTRCPDGDQLLQYAFGLLPATAFRATRDHMRDCPRCQEDLSGLRAGIKLDAETRTLSILEQLVAAGKRIWHSATTPVSVAPALSLRGDAPERFQVQIDSFTVMWVVEARKGGTVRVEGQIMGKTRLSGDCHAILSVPNHEAIKTPINKYGHFALDASALDNGLMLLDVGDDVLSIPLG